MEDGLELVRKKHFLSRKKKKQKERNETTKDNIRERETHTYHRFDEKFTRESHSRNSSLSSFFLVTSTVS